MTINDLKAENERLRQEIEAYKQRELEQLRQQLSEAREHAEHYKQEANRNASVGHQIYAEMQKQVAALQNELVRAKSLPNMRPQLVSAN